MRVLTSIIIILRNSYQYFGGEKLHDLKQNIKLLNGTERPSGSRSYKSHNF